MLPVYLFTGTEFHELFRVPHLFSHFLEHRAEHDGQSFAEYLNLHYAGEHAHDPRHADLPYGCKHKMSSCQNVSPALPHFAFIRLNRPEFSVAGIKSFFHSPPEDGVSSSIFQPPKFV